MEIIVSDKIKSICPHFVGVAVTANVRNTEYNDSLWQEINRWISEHSDKMTSENIKNIPSIEFTRKAYRALGKDPSRYRPSGEALMRRIIKGQDLYQIDTLVDLINLASITYGYSIGGFDSDKIQGNTITLGVGSKDEPYIGIGRGLLNIEGMPVYRDSIGGIGTPTSDNERTKISLDTTHFLAVINGYDGDKVNVMATALFIKDLLQKYAYSEKENVVIF